MSYFIYEVAGKNRNDATEKLSEALGVSSEQIELEVESGKSKGGILGLFKGDVSKVKVYPTDDTPIEAHVKGVLLTIVNRMGVDARVIQIGEQDGNLYVELDSEESGFIIGKHGRTLDAIQFLVNLIVNSNTRNNQRIMVDVASYRARRQKSLNRLADRMADRVAKSGRSILLNYMNPYERRIIHLALEEDDRVYTESDGHGVYKRVRVIPYKKKSGRSRGRRNDRGRGDDEFSSGEEVDGNTLPPEDEEFDDVDGNRAEDYADEDYDDDRED